MPDVTQILSQIEDGDASASENLLPLVYDELRRIAAVKMAQESPDHTLQATALVHDAYVRLVGSENAKNWNSRSHFFAAAAEAMRRILVESARKKSRLKRGGKRKRHDLEQIDLTSGENSEELLMIDDALSRLAEEDPKAAELTKLRFFAGFSLEEAAELMGMPRSTAYEQWAYAKAWLRCEFRSGN